MQLELFEPIYTSLIINTFLNLIQTLIITFSLLLSISIFYKNRKLQRDLNSLQKPSSPPR